MSGVAVVVGAGGGIGRALIEQLVEACEYDAVHALSRTAHCTAGAHGGMIDITAEASIADAAARIGGGMECLIVATGMLHAAGLEPERGLRDLNPSRLMTSFQINTIGPALVLKHFGPLLARDRRAVAGILSARVGSISDNRLGGWYGYRASKAALNMIIRSAAIELSHSRPRAICVGLHPGTVDTSLSKPFQARVPAARLFTPETAARQLLDVMRDLAPEQTGQCFAWDGAVIQP